MTVIQVYLEATLTDTIIHMKKKHLNYTFISLNPMLPIQL